MAYDDASPPARPSGEKRSLRAKRAPWWGPALIALVVGGGGGAGGMLAREKAAEPASEYRERRQDEDISELKSDGKKLHDTVTSIDTSVKVMAEAAKANVEATGKALKANEDAIRELRYERQRHKKAADYYGGKSR